MKIGDVDFPDKVVHLRGGFWTLMTKTKMVA
jgi:hypothetical protein